MVKGWGDSKNEKAHFSQPITPEGFDTERSNLCHFIDDSTRYKWVTFGLSGSKVMVTEKSNTFLDICLDWIDRDVSLVSFCNYSKVHNIFRTSALQFMCHLPGDNIWSFIHHKTLKNITLNSANKKTITTTWQKITWAHKKMSVKSWWRFISVS